MNAIQVRCPQCGATLKAGDAPRVICEYCGTEAHVQRRSQVLQRPVPPPAAMPSNARYAVQVRTASWAGMGAYLQTPREPISPPPNPTGFIACDWR